MSDIPREYVEALIRKSGMSFHLGMPHESVIEQMTKFANLLRNETLEAAELAIQCAMEFEREACAKVCEEGGKDESGRIHVQAWGCAKDIRARGEK